MNKQFLGAAVAVAIAGVQTPAPAANTHTLVTTAINANPDINNGSGLVVAAQTPFELDSSTDITCGNATGCTLVIHAMGSAFNSSRAIADQWALLPVVDGKFPPIFFIGELPTDETETSGENTVSLHVAKGVHKVHTDAFASNGATFLSYELEYQMFKP